MAIEEVDIDLDPFPPLSRDTLSFDLELLSNQPLQKTDVLEPAAIVGLEQIPHDGTARRLIGFNSDKANTPIRRPDRLLGQHAPDLIGLAAVGALKPIPDLLLSGVIVG